MVAPTWICNHRSALPCHFFFFFLRWCVTLRVTHKLYFHEEPQFWWLWNGMVWNATLRFGPGFSCKMYRVAADSCHVRWYHNSATFARSESPTLYHTMSKLFFRLLSISSSRWLWWNKARSTSATKAQLWFRLNASTLRQSQPNLQQVSNISQILVPHACVCSSAAAFNIKSSRFKEIIS